MMYMRYMVYIYIYIYTCIYIHVYTYMYMYINMYLFELFLRIYNINNIHNPISRILKMGSELFGG